MIGKHPLRVAMQHGHSVTTMLRVYLVGHRGHPSLDESAGAAPVRRSVPNGRSEPAVAVHEACAERPPVAHPALARLGSSGSRSATKSWLEITKCRKSKAKV